LTTVSAGTWWSRKTKRARVAVVPQNTVAATTSQRPRIASRLLVAGVTSGIPIEDWMGRRAE